MSQEPESRTHTSLNAIKHGCRSRQLLLPHEDPNDWIRLREVYVAEFDPRTPWMEQLLEEAVRNHWFLQRNQRNLHFAQVDLPEDPRFWNAEDHHQLALFTRYQTTAERAYHRALARLRSYHKDQLAARVRQDKSEVPKATQPPKKEPEPVVIEQWVEVRKIENRPITQFHPSNDELEERLKTTQPTPQFVHRRIFFPEGVPSQYQWTRPRKSHVTNGGLAIQRMTVETWLSLREIERKTGHAVSTGEPTLLDWRDKQA
jgi:hypothetical protein